MRLVGYQVPDGFGHIFRRAQSVHRDVIDSSLDDILGKRIHHVGPDRAGYHAVDGDALGSGLQSVLHLRERELAVKTGVAMTAESADEANAAVSAAVEVLTEAGVKAHGDIRTTLFGYAAREIVDDAIEHDADVIVMGSRGRSDLVGFILGSTAHKVIHLTDRPVLIVK
jgi:nucleotide-binding universal stress UspA family protein